MLTVEKLELVFPDFPAPALILALNDELEVIKVNNAYLHLVGTDPQYFCGRPFFEIFPDQEFENPDSVIKRVDRTIQEVLATKKPGTPGAIGYHLNDPETGIKELRFFMPEFVPIVDERGLLTHILHYTHEITEAVATNRPLLPIIASFKHILETSRHAFLLTTGEGNVLLANESACKLFGYDKEEFSKLQRHELLDYNDNRLLTLLQERERTGSSKGEITGIKKNGERFPCEYSSSRFIDVNGQKRCCTEFVDLSKWKEEQARTKRSEDNLKAIFKSALDGFILLDSSLNIMAFNEKARDFLLLRPNTKAVTLVAGSSIVDYVEPEWADFFLQVTQQVLSGEEVEYQRAYQRADGECWINFSITPVREEAMVTGICICARDITLQKHAEREVSRREERFRGLVEHNTDAIAILSADGKILYASPAAEKITGYSEEERKLIDVFDSIHPDDRLSSAKVMERVMNEPGVPVKASPLRVRNKEGQWKWIEATITNMLHDPAINGIIDNFRDVTDWITAQQELIVAQQDIKQSEEKYRKIFNLSPLPKWVYDLKTLRILEVNEEAIRRYGYSRAEFIGKSILDIRPPEDAGKVKEEIKGLNHTEQGLKRSNYWRHLKKNGEIITVDVFSHAVEYNGRAARMVISRDVTKQLKMETELIESNERFQLASCATSDAVWAWEMTTETVFIGEGYKNLFGYAEGGSIVPRSWLQEKLHPDDRAHVEAKIDAVFYDHIADRWQVEYRFRKADGSWAVVFDSAILLRDQQGKPLRMVGAAKDITKRKAEEHHLRLLESVVTNATDAVMITGISNDTLTGPEIIYVNPAFEKITGYSFEEIKKIGTVGLVGEETDEKEMAKLITAMKNGEDCSIVTVFYKKTKEKYWASLVISPVTDAEGQIKNYIAIERDVTERMEYLRAIEDQNKQLLEIAWLQSHIVRTPIARILGLTDLMVNEPYPDTIKEVLPRLKISAEELDQIICDIIAKTNAVDIGKSSK